MKTRNRGIVVWNSLFLLMLLVTHAVGIVLNPSDELEVSHNPFNRPGSKESDNALHSRISDHITRFAEEESLRGIIRRKLLKYKAEVVEALDLPSDDTEDATTIHQDEESHSRTKRATITADSPQLLGRRRRKIPMRATEEGSYIIRSVFRLSPQFFDHVKTLDINAVVIHNQTYMFTLEQTPTNKTEIGIYIVGTSLNPKEISRAAAPGAIALDVVQIDKYYYILPLVYSWTANNSVDTMDVGSIIYRVDLLRRKLDKVQTIRTAYAHSSVFWKGSDEEANNIFLAVAPEYTETDRGRRFAVEVPCYRWQGGYFDYVKSIPASNPQAIRHFNIFSHDYLAISNYQDDSGSTNIHSEVFKYYHTESRFVSFQRIRTYGAKDIQHFEFRSGQRVEHFLAVANHCQRDENGRPNYRVKSFIMKFASQRFIPFKSFYTYGALQFLPVTMDDKFYLVLVEISGIRIFQYSGWTFVQTYQSNLPEMGLSFYSLKLRKFQYENQPFFAISSVADNFQGGLYSVQFDQRNDFSKLTSGLEKWCLAAKARMDQVNITQLEEEVKRAVKVDDTEILLSHPLTFSGPLQLNNLITKTMKHGGIRFDDDLLRLLIDQFAQVGVIQESLTQLEKQMTGVVFRDQDHSISSKIVFKDLKYNGDRLISGDASVNQLNGIDIPELFKLLIFRNKDFNFSSLKIDSVETKDNLQVLQLNGSPLSDYAVKHPKVELVFTKKNTFTKEVTAILGLKLTGLLDGVDFNKPKFLLAQGNQTFGELVQLNNCSLNQLSTKHLNGFNVDEYFKDAVPLLGDAVITGSKKFKEITIDNLDVDGLVNGFNLKSLIKTAIRTSGRDYQNFKGQTQFQSLVAGEVSLGNKLVNRKFNLEKDFVNINFGTYSLGDVVLLEDTFVKELTVQQKLNRIGVVDGQLDVLLKDSSRVQRIRNKRIQELHFENDVIADGLVDGVNLKDWSPERRILLKNSQIYRNYTILGNLSVPKGILVKSRFQQDFENILPILKNIALLNSTKLPGSCTLTFESMNIQGNTDLRRDINGIKPTSWVLKNNVGAYNITGTKQFLGELTLEQHCGAKALYGTLDAAAENILKVFPNLLLNGVDQNIFGDTAFTKLLKVNNIDCRNIVVDSVPFENIMLKNGNQEIDVKTFFNSHVKIEDSVTVTGRLDVGSVNGVKLTEAIKDTLRTGNISGTQIIQGEYNFEGGLLVEEIETDGLVGGYDLGTLFASMVRKDRKQPLHLQNTAISFQNGIDLNSLKYSGELNGIKHTEWGDLWLLSSGNQTVYTYVEFLDDLTVDKDFFVKNGRVGDLDVIQLNNQILRMDEGGYLGHVTFHRGVDVTESIQMNPGAKLNGIDLRKDVLLRNTTVSSEQVVSGEKTFESGWTISGNLITKNIDGLNLQNFLRFLFDTNPESFKNDTLVIEGNLNLKSEPEVTRSVDGLEWSDILKDVWFTDGNVTIKNQVVFQDLNLDAGGSFTNSQSKLSGLNLDELKNTYISKSRDQTWTGNVEFGGGAYFEEVQVQDLTLNSGLFKGVNLKEFLQSILTNGTDQVLQGEWYVDQLDATNITLAPGVLINNVNVFEDLMTLNGPNKVTGKKFILNLLINNLRLGPDTLLAGVNMTDWSLNSVKTVGNNDISVPLVFENFEDEWDMTVLGLVDGIIFDKDHVLLKNGSQTILGKMTIHSDGGETAALTAPEGIIIDGLFNNYDLNQTFSSLVLKSEFENDTTPLVIEGRKVILAPIQVDHFRAEKLFQGINMTQLLNDFYTGLIIPPNLTFKAQERYDDLADFTRHVSQISSRRAVFLEHFVFTQEIAEQSLFTNIWYGTRSPTLVIGSQKSTNVVTENWWSYSLTTDFYQRQLGTRFLIQGKVMGYKEIESDFGHFLILSVASSNKRPAELALDVQKSLSHFDIDKGPGNISKTFILKSVDIGTASATSVITQIIHGRNFGPLESFSIHNGATFTECFLVAKYESVDNSTGRILCLDSNSVFTPFQAIPLNNPTVTSSMLVMRTAFLMIATGSKGDDPEGVVEIWSHSGGFEEFKKESCIPVFNFVSMDSVLGSNSNSFLAVASGEVPTSRYLGSVFMYKYSIAKREFEKTQTLEINFPLQVRLLTMSPSAEVFLFVLTKDVMDNIRVYKYQGLSGWNLQHKWTSEGGLSLKLADFEMEGVFKAQVLVTSPNATRIYTAEFKGLSGRAHDMSVDEYRSP